MSEIIIKKGLMELVKTDRNNLVDANQTHDGMVFNFKNNFSLNYIDNYLPIGLKDIIVNTLNSFPNAQSIVIDFGNYSKPIVANM